MRVWALALFGCTGGLVGGVDTDAPAGPARQWVSLNYVPCALDTEGRVECWTSDRWAAFSQYLVHPPPSQVPLKRLNALSLVWGVRQDDGMPHLVLPFNNLYPQALPRVADLTDLTNHCALDRGQIVCWDVRSASPFPTDRSYRALGGANLAIAAVDEFGILHHDPLAPQLGWTSQGPVSLPAGTEVEEVIATYDSACVLGRDGAITCFGDLAGTFDEPPYTHLRGSSLAACAVRAADDRIVCNDGSTFDWGPVRDLLVFNSGTYVLVDGVWTHRNAQWGDPPQLCAITTSNAIRCAGWRYDFADLQAALPRGDGGAW